VTTSESLVLYVLLFLFSFLFSFFLFEIHSGNGAGDVDAAVKDDAALTVAPIERG
jgi:hypothetical protein